MTPNELTQEEMNKKTKEQILGFFDDSIFSLYNRALLAMQKYADQELAAEKLRSSKLLEALKGMYYIFVEIGFREDGELAAPFDEVLSAYKEAKNAISAYES